MTLDAAPVKVSRARRALSEIFAHLARSKQERVSVDDIVGRLSDRSIGACLVLFAAPNLLPLPPGVSSILAIPLIFVAAQLMIGTKGVWLPRPILAWSLHSRTYRSMASKLSRIMLRAEKFVRPRFRFITTRPSSASSAPLPSSSPSSSSSRFPSATSSRPSRSSSSASALWSAMGWSRRRASFAASSRWASSPASRAASFLSSRGETASSADG